MKLGAHLMLLVAVLTCAVIIGCEESTKPLAIKSETRESALLPESSLNVNCYPLPSDDLPLGGRVALEVAFGAGDPAIEFELRDPTGRTHRLSTLLESRPVLIVFGAYS